MVQEIVGEINKIFFIVKLVMTHEIWTETWQRSVRSDGVCQCTIPANRFLWFSLIFLVSPDLTIELFVANCDRDFVYQQLSKPKSRFILYISRTPTVRGCKRFAGRNSNSELRQFFMERVVKICKKFLKSWRSKMNFRKKVIFYRGYSRHFLKCLNPDFLFQNSILN